jgi:uncharacterized membrane protein HdeD (DUF308 family)
MSEATTPIDPSARLARLPAAWLWMVVGVLSVIAGVVVLIKPGGSLVALAVITGVFVLVDGVSDLLRSLGADAEDRLAPALLGVVSIVIGILLIRHPFSGVAGIALLLGIWFVAVGIVRLTWTIRSGGSWRRALLGGVQIVAGVVILAAPDVGFATLALLAGISLIAYGIVLVTVGWMLRLIGPAVESGAADAPVAR